MPMTVGLWFKQRIKHYIYSQWWLYFNSPEFSVRTPRQTDMLHFFYLNQSFALRIQLTPIWWRNCVWWGLYIIAGIYSTYSIWVNSTRGSSVCVPRTHTHAPKVTHSVMLRTRRLFKTRANRDDYCVSGAWNLQHKKNITYGEIE